MSCSLNHNFLLVKFDIKNLIKRFERTGVSFQSEDILPKSLPISPLKVVPEFLPTSTLLLPKSMFLPI
jgi:hypothetical protein